MDATEFRRRAKEMVDYVADYLENIERRRPLAAVQPGYLKDLIPSEAPVDPEPWEDVFKDVERVIMPGVSYNSLANLQSYTVRCTPLFITPLGCENIYCSSIQPQCEHVHHVAVYKYSC